ncbi:MAG: heterodisulfide reductase-related iron-sulfur binding cluster [Rikenellaceae bacterium]
MGHYFHLFTIPFTVGMLFLFTVLIVKYTTWIKNLSASDKCLVKKGICTISTFKATWNTIKESLLHVSIFKRNRLLGFMHASLAFGWFLLIVVGAMESSNALRGSLEMPYVHIFLKFFVPTESNALADIYAHIMDALLLIILIGVALAWYKRFNSKRMGMRKTTKHTLGDRVAIASLWAIFPARLLAEGVTCGLNGSGGFMTHTIGEWLVNLLPFEVLAFAELPMWWIYSLALGVFFVALPFSRYMHIFTEIPHIFLKEYGVRPSNEASSIDNFQIQACSRCGLCIDNCQLQSDLNITKQLPVYFLRDRRYGKDCGSSADECLMCGRCSVACPVGIDINMLRQNSRNTLHKKTDINSYSYLQEQSVGSGKVGYFSGCMTKLTPATITSMLKIFAAAGDDAVYLDEEGGVCCGRPLMLSGEIESARKLMDFNKALIAKSGITTLVTSCPICLKVFKEEYDLKGVEIIHHTQYIDRLISQGRIKVNPTNLKYTYHDPCELGRGSKIYDEPRRVISVVGELVEAASNRENSRCCGSSLAHTSLLTAQKQQIRDITLSEFVATGAEVLVTSCPLCMSSFNTKEMTVKDISEIVVGNIR